MSTFADDRVLARLKNDFIPFAGNTHELQNGRSKSQQWFVRMAESVNPRVTRGQTSQGFYVCLADGQAFGFNNNRDPERVLDFMSRGLAKAKVVQPVTVKLGTDDLASSYNRPAAPGTSVIRVFSRVRPLPQACDPLNASVGRDHLWILADEVRALNERAELPPALVARLARFHLVDNVRGEPDHWRVEEVKQADFTAHRVRPGLIAFSGRFKMRTSDDKRGLEGSIEGEIRVQGDRITRFRAFSKATAWGTSTYTQGAPPGKFGLVFAMVEASDAASRVVTPQAAFYGEEYLSSHLGAR